MKQFFYTYVLLSQMDGKRYIGYTNNLQRRIAEHNSGKNFSTALHRPFDLIYCEACLSEEDARQRELYLKSTISRRYITKRLRNFLRTIQS
ncbi:MAG: GIY-YIG nuclease family protein [Candidatus Yanofskybacteria bacterium]|nr:GIY-YIG nuclease family protein [Candidatus Yanofskybacteria bacterium]